jgi:bifunctional DNA-binding transcriptional regulator/antitoxin component of YhaV-PrlF toxin-antitoxin module
MTKATTIRSIGNSAGTTIPKAMPQRYQIAEGDRVHLVETEDGILITAARERTRLKPGSVSGSRARGHCRSRAGERAVIGCLPVCGVAAPNADDGEIPKLLE